MHFDLVGRFIEQQLIGSRLALRVGFVDEFEIPRQDHSPCANRVKLPEQRQVVAVTRDEYTDAEALVHCKLKRLQCECDIDTGFASGRKRQEMRYDASA